MFSRITLFLLFGFVASVALAGCDRNTDRASVALSSPKTVDDRFAIKVGERAVAMQVAARPDETQKGLMYVKSMGEDHGMIFLFEQPQRMSFWMRNTEIPLDIGYFDALGVLKEVYPMYPHDETPVRSHSKELQFAVEMNQGWYARNDVKPGAQLDLKALANAIRERGFKPQEWGIEESPQRN